MTLSELLKPNLILPKAAASKEALIARLAERVYETDHGLPLAQKDLLKAINMREQIGGTLLPSGLAIPHARIKDFEDFIFAIGTPAQPLIQEGREIRMAAMMITNQSGGAWYLAVLAALTKLSKDKEYFARLCEAENPEDFLAILRERDTELG
jgi:PTS system nitrogen regulatory IIA component